MLSDKTKTILKRVVDLMRDELGEIDEMREAGPVVVVDNSIDECRQMMADGYEYAGETLTELQNNRPEAERFMAGLLGMM